MNNSANTILKQSRKSQPAMALFNNGFKPNYRHTIFNNGDVSMRALKANIESWAFSNKIRMKLRIGDPDDESARYAPGTTVVYFEDDMDLAAFKLKFNV